jgi:hypothetical protein
MSGYQRLTREELYELVWSTPATKLGERFSLSGRGLAKLCARHEIPVPERGWWAKKAAGHNVKQPPLLPAKTRGIETVRLYVRDDFRQWLTTEERESFEKRLLEESTAPPPVVPEIDDSRHPLIIQARKKRRNQDGPVPLHLDIEVSDSVRDRAIRLATGLVNACENRGYSFKTKPESTNGVAAVHVFGQPIGIRIFEPPRRVPHPLTPAEAREKAVGRGSQIPEYDSVPSGELMILLDHTAGSERQSFSGGQKREIEAVLPDVLKTLIRIAMRLRADQNRRDQELRQRQEAAELRRREELQRQEEQARIVAERKRRRELLRDTANLHCARTLRELIAAVEQAASSEGVEEDALAEWVKHAKTVAESLNPVQRIVKALRDAQPSGQTTC